MDHATDVGARLERLLTTYTGRKATVEVLHRDRLVNVLELWQDDGTSFVITVVQTRD